MTRGDVADSGSFGHVRDPEGLADALEQPAASDYVMLSAAFVHLHRAVSGYGRSVVHEPLAAPFTAGNQRAGSADRLAALETLRDEMVDPVGVRCCPEAGFRRGLRAKSAHREALVSRGTS